MLFKLQGFELDGISQFESLFTVSTSLSRSYPRSLMLYNYYNDESEDLDFWTKGGGAIRNARYKLMHAYNASTWYDPDEELPNDDDSNLDTANDCSQDSQMAGDFEVLTYKHTYMHIHTNFLQLRL
jgi:hypothetical protein